MVTEASVQAPIRRASSPECETEAEQERAVAMAAKLERSAARLGQHADRACCKRYDQDPVIMNKLLPIDEAQRAAGAWPQYYIGAYPYCFRLPVLRDAALDGSRAPAGAHDRDDVDADAEEAARLADGPGAGDPLVSRAQAWLDHDQRRERHDRRLHHRRRHTTMCSTSSMNPAGPGRSPGRARSRCW